MTNRNVAVLSNNPWLQQMAPLHHLLQDCQEHGKGLTDQWNRAEYIAVSATILTQDTEHVAVRFDDDFSVSVSLDPAHIDSPPVSVWCYIEEYDTEQPNTLGLRLRQKDSGRKVEMYGTNKRHLTAFLASPRFTDARDDMPNLYEKEGYRDYVLVSGGSAVDSYDVLLFEDDAILTYLLGPSPDTAYRDAFRALDPESASASHARTAQKHFEKGHYREAILAARLAVETGCGGRGKDVKARLENAPQNVAEAGSDLFEKRNLAVHEGDTRVEQSDARQALRAMATVLDFVRPTDDAA